MGKVAPQPSIASAYFVIFGHYGQVSHFAQQRGVCRQRVYREAHWVQQQLHHTQQENRQLRQQAQDLQQHLAALEQRLKQAVVLDKDKQEEFACAAQAQGVSLPVCRNLLEVLNPGQVASVAQLGRATQAAGTKAGRLLAVLDEVAQPLVRDVAADEIYVPKPVLMVVEQESLCWLSGQLSPQASGEAWAEQFQKFPNLQQVARDGGNGLKKGVAAVNAQRPAQGRPAVLDQGDHFHALRKGSVALRQDQQRAAQALAAAEKAQKAVADCQRQGVSSRLAGVKAWAAWQKGEKAMDQWSEHERLWQRSQEALRLFTPEGNLNTRAQAEAVLAEALAPLPAAYAKAKAHLHKPEMLNYLDEVQAKLAALPFPEEVTQAAVRQEGLRRRPELLEGEGTRAVVYRGILLSCAVALSKAGAMGQQAQAAVREILARAYRASSLVECIYSVLRMQQARHRKLTPGLLDLKRLYWNCHTFRSGRRRGTTPYGRLGVPWPEGLRWGEVLKLTPEQLRDKLSTAKKAA